MIDHINRKDKPYSFETDIGLSTYDIALISLNKFKRKKFKKDEKNDEILAA